MSIVPDILEMTHYKNKPTGMAVIDMLNLACIICKRISWLGTKQNIRIQSYLGSMVEFYPCICMQFQS